MKNKDLSDLRSKDLKELNKLLSDNKSELLKIKLDMSTGQESNLKKAKHLKKDIAQILTLIREKQIVRGFENDEEKGDNQNTTKGKTK